GILFGYLALIDKRVLQTSRVHMGEMLNQSTVALKNQIISYKKTIEDFSAIISQNHYDQLFLPEFRDELDKSAIISNFSRILVADVNGDCYIKKDKKINLAQRDYFIAALSGKTNISATVAKQQSQYDEVSNCAAPIYDKNSKVCGVLIATLKDSSFESILSASFFGDEGRITVVDDKGNSLFNSNMKNERKGKQEKIDTAILNLDQKSKDSIQEKIKQNNAGILTFKSENETYHMGYAPLFLENWYVNATVNQKTINIKSLAIRKTTMGFLLIFSLFFLALIFYIVTYQNKSREKIDKSKLQLETVIKNIPGGVVRFSTEQDFPIIFLNKGLLKLTGYATDQIATVLDNKFISLVHHEDYERFLKTIDKAKNVKHPVQIDCRIKCNNGGYKW
ncbi:MAG: cache domain-containing protein, partial [Oscillospiraceae bacterium]